MNTVYQEDLREGRIMAVWAGDIENEGELCEYLGRSFGNDFGFLLDSDDLPEFSCSYTEPRRRARYNQPFQKVDVKELLGGFSSSAGWADEARRLCHQKGIEAAKTVVMFPHLRYREALCRNPRAPLRFIGNVSWPGGTESWAELQSKRIILPPFPKLIRCDWEGSDSFSWQGIVRLESWKGFATDAEISGMDDPRPKSNQPEEDFSFDVQPATRDRNSRPTGEQARAFSYLVNHQAAIRDAVLAAIFKEYPKLRENYFGEEWSSDGGKTYKSGWELPDMCPPENMPDLKTPKELMRIIQPGRFNIRAEANGGLAQIRIGFGCKWDEEHGFAVMIRRGVEVEVGDFDLGI